MMTATPACMPDEHEWVLHMIQMPQGCEKPGMTLCRKCGAAQMTVAMQRNARLAQALFVPRPFADDTTDDPDYGF